MQLHDLDDDIIKCELVSKSGQRFACTRKQLGKGTYSKVYKGYFINPDTDEKKPRQYVAIKKMSNLQLKAYECLENEIEIMKQLNHPNILKLIDVIEEQSTQDDDVILYIILEYCGGGDLKRLITDKHRRENKKLKEKYAIYYFKQIAEGLQYLRSHNVVHRDLKLHNILLSEDRRTLKIADFGFAKVIENETLVETLCGTPLYMAPEILQKKPYTIKADLWSVGVMLYEVLCGTHPFSSIDSMFDLVHRINQDNIQIPNFISWPCRDLLKRLLKKNATERIEWDDFFNHKWLNPDTISNSIAHSISNSVSSNQHSTISSSPLSIYHRTLKSSSIPIINNYNPDSPNTPKTISPKTISPKITSITPNFGQSPPSFIHSPVIRELRIIENYTHPDRVKSTPILAFSSNTTNTTTNNNPLTNNPSISTSQSLTGSNISSTLSDYLGTSIKMLKDSFKTQTFNSVP